MQEKNYELHQPTAVNMSLIARVKSSESNQRIWKTGIITQASHQMMQDEPYTA